jgi:hypothetical protein
MVIHDDDIALDVIHRHSLKSAGGFTPGPNARKSISARR